MTIEMKREAELKWKWKEEASEKEGGAESIDKRERDECTLIDPCPPSVELTPIHWSDAAFYTGPMHSEVEAGQVSRLPSFNEQNLSIGFFNERPLEWKVALIRHSATWINSWQLHRYPLDTIQSRIN